MVKWDDDNEPHQLEYNRAHKRRPLTPREFQERARNIGAIIIFLLVFVMLAVYAVLAFFQ